MNGMGISISMDETQNQAAPLDIPPRVKLWHIARTFLGIGLASFSLAALGEARNWMTKKRRWFTDEEYMQGLGLAQLLPGAPTVNLSSYLGFRLRGLPGAAAATLFFLIPCFLLMPAHHKRWAQNPILAASLNHSAEKSTSWYSRK